MRGLILVVFVVGAALASGSMIAWAQDVDDGECQQVCREQQEVCVTACSERPNPVECEAQCRDAVEDCLRQCR